MYFLFSSRQDLGRNTLFKGFLSGFQPRSDPVSQLWRAACALVVSREASRPPRCDFLAGLFDPGSSFAGMDRVRDAVEHAAECGILVEFLRQGGSPSAGPLFIRSRLLGGSDPLARGPLVAAGPRSRHTTPVLGRLCGKNDTPSFRPCGSNRLQPVGFELKVFRVGTHPTASP